MILRTLVALLVLTAPVTRKSFGSTSSRAPTCSPAKRSAPPVPTKSSPARSISPSIRATRPTTIIADIDKAPRNAAGKVEFSSDFY